MQLLQMLCLFKFRLKSSDKIEMISTSRSITRWTPSFWVFFAAILVRVLHLISSSAILPYELRLNDGMFFDALAGALARGEHNSAMPVVGLSPAYVGFLYLFQKLIGPDLIWPRIAQIIIGSFACVGLQQITKNLFGSRAGWIAGLLAAFCGIFIYFDMLLIKASLSNSLFIFFLWIFQRGLESPLAAVPAGFAFMTACMLRMQMVMTLPWVLWVGIKEIWQKRQLKIAMGLILFLVAIVATEVAWGHWFQAAMARTKGVPTAQEVAAPQSGIHFYMGNHPNANGTYKRVQGIRPSAVGHVFDARKIAEEDLKKPLNMWQVNTFWTAQAIKSVVENPKRWIVLELKKFFLIWNAYEIPNSHHYDYWRKFSKVLSLPLVSYGWLAPLALIGWIRLRNDRRLMVSLLKGFAVSYILGLLLTFVTADYRLPFHPIWIVFSAFALDQIWNDLMEKRMIVLRNTAFVFLALFLFCNYQTYLSKSRYDQYMQKRFDTVLSPKKPVQPQAPIESKTA